MALAAVSCTVEEIESDLSEEIIEPRQEVTIEATLVNGSGTKTIRNAEGKVLWKPADQIKVFSGAATGQFTSTNEANAQQASFTGTLPVSTIIGFNEGTSADSYLYGLYPYSESATYSAGTITTTLTNTQTCPAGTFADDMFITVAKANSFALAFYSVLSGFKFSVTAPGIHSVTFKGNEDEVLTGTLPISFGNDGKPVIGEITNAHTSITVIPEGGAFEVGESYYILFAPVTLKSGFQVTMTKDGAEGTFEYNKEITFSRNTFVNKDDIDSGVSFHGALVDLGLSVQWYSTNIGAQTPEQNGGYYQWAGTDDVTSTEINLTPQSAPYAHGYSVQFTKYVQSFNESDAYLGTPDGKTVLDLEDDIAFDTYGEYYRVPSREEWAELGANCTITKVSDYEGTGVAGHLYTSKVAGFTDKSIFIPNSSSRAGNEFDPVYDVALLWTRNLDDSRADQAICARLEDAKVNVGLWLQRYNGLNVRAVYDHKPGLSAAPVDVEAAAASDLQMSPVITHNIGLWTLGVDDVDGTVVTGAVAQGNDIVFSVSRNIFRKARTGSITMKLSDPRNVLPDIKYTVTINQAASPTEPMVDLGLSVEWSMCNIGAIFPYEAGGFYQWGGKEDVTSTELDLTWSNCPFHTGSNESSGWTKYIPEGATSWWSGAGSPDGISVLRADDDIVTSTFGSEWRMPTKDEWLELKNNCTLTWTEDYNGTGVKGTIVESNVSGYEGNSIFLPAPGIRTSTELSWSDMSGYYWSSTRDTDYYNDADYINTNNHGQTTGPCNRFAGCSVRGVHFVPVTSITLNKTALELMETYSETLTATILPANATDKKVTWTSSDPSVATVDYQGKVTAVKTGTCTITASTENGTKLATCDMTVNIVPVASVSLNLVNLALTVSQQMTLVPTISPDIASIKTVTWTSSDPSVATVDNGVVTGVALGTCTITATSVQGGKVETCPVKVYDPIENGHEFVDLGFTTLWATCNVGATVPEGYGDHFAWGEIEPKLTFTWGNYKWYNSEIYRLTKYSDTDNIGVIDHILYVESEDDAATQNWHGNWRMPASGEISELCTLCNWTWTTVNGVYGALGTSKFNGNTIFFPAAGLYDTDENLDGSSIGHVCGFWGNERATNNFAQKAECLYFDDSKNYLVGMDTRYRFGGYSVRAVFRK